MEPASPSNRALFEASDEPLRALQIPLYAEEMDAEMTTPCEDDDHEAAARLSQAARGRSDSVEQTDAQLQRVRGLLREMLSMGSWGERDHEDWERRKLQELRECVLDDASLESLQQLPKRMCAYEFKPGDIAWNCKVCQVDETCVMCNDCFISSDHENHEVFFYYTQSGGCCDCGDTEAWASDGFCTEHRGAHDADPLAYFRPDLLTSSRACLGEVLSLVLRTITEARAMPVVDTSGVDRVRAKLAFEPADNRYSVLVHFNEMQSSQEFATALTRALPAISYQTLKIVGEATAHKQSVIRSRATRDEAVEVVDAMCRHGLVSSIVPSDYKAKMPVVSTLLQWLVSMANLSDGFCRLVCEQFIAHSCDDALVDPDYAHDEKHYEEEFPVLRAIILADSFLPKQGSDALHSLLMALLADPVFKKSFAVAFTRCYRQLYRECFVGIGSSSVTILTFSVQFFNRASFVKLLVLDHELLEVLVASVLETLKRKPRRQPLLSQQPSTSSLAKVMAPFLSASSNTIDQWDLFAFAIQRAISKGSSTIRDVNVSSLEAEAAKEGFVVRKNADTPDGETVFLSLPATTELPGKVELDVSSPVFVYRRYLSGLLDLRYAVQIEGISELFVLEKNGARLADFLLYLSYVQGVCPEVRRFGDHVEVESRAWVVTVEFVSTASDIFTWIIANVFKLVNIDTSNDNQLRSLVSKLIHTIMEAYYFWLASIGKYFPPVSSSEYAVGKCLSANPVDASVSCHYPLHRTVAQLIRTLCDSPRSLDIFYELMHNSPDGSPASPWVYGADHPIGFWHRVNLIEPVLQSIVWDAEVHSGLWVRNGLSVLNHSMNYGEPPFCLRFRDHDLLLVQFGFQLLGIDWMMDSVINRFRATQWYEAGTTGVHDSELMASECMVLLCQFASELPPRVSSSDPLRSLVAFLRREIVQRLIVGPCAHSDLAKIATEFFAAHDNLFASKFSTGPILDLIVNEVCVETTPSTNGSLFGETSSTGGGKVLYRLKPELYAEYIPTFVHLTRKQHEAAHENWFQHRLRSSKAKELQQDNSATTADATRSTWLDFPLVKNVLPCARGFRVTRLSILHPHACKLVYETMWRASTDSQCSLNILSRAVHLFTLQVYVVEDIRYTLSTPASSDADEQYRTQAKEMVDNFLTWITGEQTGLRGAEETRQCVLQLLLQLDPWVPGNGSNNMVNLDGDQKHEIGRGVDWLVHRLARLDGESHSRVEQYRMTREASREEEDRKALLLKRRREAQMRAIQQMQQRQAAFAVQMQMMAETSNDEDDTPGETNGDAASVAREKRESIAMGSAEENGALLADIPMEDDVEPSVSQPECAMCHSTESENSFMCYVGFAQCSPVFSRVNGEKGRFLSTPIDEMHLGEDVPVHLRLCGHSVHHTCWESYHASQFQRAITGGHHRHALNAVDVTKKEFLCPLCKSISNVLIPTTTDELNQLMADSSRSSDTPTEFSQQDLLEWLNQIGRKNSKDSDESMEDENEQKPDRFQAEQSTTAPVADLPPRVRAWLEDGLSSLCMAIRKVACGATQKSRPDRYTASGCLALFHTLLCTFLGSPERDQLRPEQRFLEAMRFLPLMLEQVSKPPRPVNGSTQQASSAVATSRQQISHLLYYGGSDILFDGTIVLEEEHPSTQTQTRKQSQWGKVRWPTKPLLLTQLGTVLVKGILLADTEEEAIYFGRLIVLARLVQSVLWYTITRHEDFTDNMADELTLSEENMEFFVATMMDEQNRTMTRALECVEQLRVQLLEQCGGVFGAGANTIDNPQKLLNLAATEVVPILKVTTFLLKARFRPQSFKNKLTMKPVFIDDKDVAQFGFITVDSLWSHSADLQPVVGRWVQRFKAAYDEMNDPQGVLQQWFTTANMGKVATTKLNYAQALGRDLNTVHTSMSVFASGSNRTRYLRSLPRAYVKFYAALAKRKCAACNQFPARPAVCLCCGMLLCAASTCPSIQHDKGYPEESNPGACTVHAKKCGRGSCMFLLVLEGAVLLVYWKLAAYVGSLYVDEYGEEFGERNRELAKGRPLYLNAERRDRLLRLWMHHEIPNEVVRIQNSSDRVIRNSHY